MRYETDIRRVHELRATLEDPTQTTAALMRLVVSYVVGPNFVSFYYWYVCLHSVHKSL